MQQSNIILDSEIDDLEKLLIEVDENKDEITSDITTTSNTQSSSAIATSAVHSGDTDSSDDEDVKNFLERKYNEYGRDVHNILKNRNEESRENRSITEKPKSSTKSAPTSNLNVKKINEPVLPQLQQQPLISSFEKFNVYTDPVFGLRIIHPLISSTLLLERMQGRTPIGMNKVRYHTEQGDKTKDWVIAGVIVSKSPVKTTKKGDSYAIWQLSDLKNDIKTISLFLFKAAFKELWKTSEGMVISVLNPSVLDRRDDKIEAVLSIDNSDKIMVLGQSKDLGRCKSKKKNGEPCTAIVNANACEFCVYHVKQEYGKASNRSDLISSTAGRGLNELRNKLMGKSTNSFYSNQNESFVSAKKSVKLMEKDNNRLLLLSEYNVSPNQNTTNHVSTNKNTAPSTTEKSSAIRTAASSIDVSVQDRQKDLKRLQLLEKMNSIPQKTNPSLSSFNLLNHENIKTPPPQPQEKTSKSYNMNITPKLSSGNFSFSLTSPPSQNDRSKAKALEILKGKPLPKSNPNFIKHRGTLNNRKRALEDIACTDESVLKKQKLDAENEAKAKKDKLLAIMNAKSSHVDLIDAHDNEQQQKYFNNLEKKEAMEEKMLNTMSVACKAVTCLQCKYIAFSAADKCRQENHTLKVRDGEKRFFKCLDCGNRTITLHKIPKISCKNCHGSRWDRAGMINEKKIAIGNTLSIRGDEEKFIDSMKMNC